jgi:hypothetical protein
MGKINLGRVILGGLVAGLVINIGEFVLNGVILKTEWDDAMKALNKPPMSDSAVAIFLALGFVLGFLILWVYAAIRPRLGPGPKTAICAGLVVWALSYLYPIVGQLPIDLFPRNMLFIGLVWGLFEVPIGALAGAWLYKEG